VRNPWLLSPYRRADSSRRRIGPVPNLSMIPGQQVQPPPTQPVLTSTAYNRRPSEERQDKASQFNTAPIQPANGYIANGGFKVDEFGHGIGNNTPNTVSGGTLPASTTPSRYVDPRTGGSGNRRPGSNGGRPGSSGNRPGSSGGRNRLLVANMDDDIPEESPINPKQTSPPKPPSPPQQQQRWLTAEEEKRRLYDSAVARVEQVQGVQSIPPPEPSPPLHQVRGTLQFTTVPLIPV